MQIYTLKYVTLYPKMLVFAMLVGSFQISVSHADTFLKQGPILPKRNGCTFQEASRDGKNWDFWHVISKTPSGQPVSAYWKKDAQYDGVEGYKDESKDFQDCKGEKCVEKGLIKNQIFPVHRDGTVINQAPFNGDQVNQMATADHVYACAKEGLFLPTEDEASALFHCVKSTPYLSEEDALVSIENFLNEEDASDLNKLFLHWGDRIFWSATWSSFDVTTNVGTDIHTVNVTFSSKNGIDSGPLNTQEDGRAAARCVYR